MIKIKYVFRFLALSCIIFVLISIITFSNELPSDGSLNVGFPKIFYSKSHGMFVATGEQGMSEDFRIKSLAFDIGFAAVIALIVMVLYRLFFRRKS